MDGSLEINSIKVEGFSNLGLVCAEQNGASLDVLWALHVIRIFYRFSRILGSTLRGEKKKKKKNNNRKLET